MHVAMVYMHFHLSFVCFFKRNDLSFVPSDTWYPVQLAFRSVHKVNISEVSFFRDINLGFLIVLLSMIKALSILVSIF